jgi:hypothetical protein
LLSPKIPNSVKELIIIGIRIPMSMSLSSFCSDRIDFIVKNTWNRTMVSPINQGSLKPA